MSSKAGEFRRVGHREKDRTFADAAVENTLGVQGCQGLGQAGSVGEKLLNGDRLSRRPPVCERHSARPL